MLQNNIIENRNVKSLNKYIIIKKLITMTGIF